MNTALTVWLLLGLLAIGVSSLLAAAILLLRSGDSRQTTHQTTITPSRHHVVLLPPVETEIAEVRELYPPVEDAAA